MHTRHNLSKIKEIVFSKEMMLFEKRQFLRNNSYSFMKNAGKKVFQFINKNFDNNQPIIVLCGPGNNGGDGFVIAKYLKNHGYPINVYILSKEHNYKGDALTAVKEFGKDFKKIGSFQLKKNALIVDALFGIGLTRNIKGILIKIFNKINNSNNRVVSVDIPSGVCSNTGEILGSAIKADFTITFHRKKVGHVLGSGKKFSGKLIVVDIGFTQGKMKTRCLENSPSLWIKYFSWKKPSGHKYSRGRGGNERT